MGVGFAAHGTHTPRPSRKHWWMHARPHGCGCITASRPPQDSVCKLFCDVIVFCLSVESVDKSPCPPVKLAKPPQFALLREFFHFEKTLHGGGAKRGGSVLRGSRGGRRQPSLRPIPFASACVRRTPNSPASSTCAHLYLFSSTSALPGQSLDIKVRYASCFG